MLIFLKVLLPRVVALARLWWLLTEGDLDQKLQASKAEDGNQDKRFEVEVAKSKDTRLLYLLMKLRSSTAIFLAFLVWYVIWLIVWSGGHMASGTYSTLNQIWGCVVAILACRLVAIAIAQNIGTTFNRSQNFVRLHDAVQTQLVLAKLAAPCKARKKRLRKMAGGGDGPPSKRRQAFADISKMVPTSSMAESPEASTSGTSGGSAAATRDSPTRSEMGGDSSAIDIAGLAAGSASAIEAGEAGSKTKKSTFGFSNMLTSKGSLNDFASAAGFSHKDVQHMTSFVKKTNLVAYVAPSVDNAELEESEYYANVHSGPNGGAGAPGAGRPRAKDGLVRLEVVTKEGACAYGRAIFANVVMPPRRPWSACTEADLEDFIPSPSMRARAWRIFDPHETGLAGEDEFAAAAEKAFTERRNLSRSLKDIDHTIAKLVTILVVIAYGIAFFICLFILGVDVTGAWLAISGGLLAFTFVFGRCDMLAVLLGGQPPAPRAPRENRC